MAPAIVWILVVHLTLSGTEHLTEIYQTEGDCVSLGIYHLAHTPHVSPKGGETYSCGKYRLEATR